MKSKKDANDPNLPDRPIAGALPGDVEDMKPERIGLTVTMPDGIKMDLEIKLAPVGSSA